MTASNMTQPTPWQPHVVLVDADYLDRVAFNLTVNFERMLERRVPPADLPHWLDCIALDGGLRPGHNAVQALFIHSAGKSAFDNFRPACFATDLDGKAFTDNLGEFCLSCFATERITTLGDFVVECFDTLCAATEVKSLMMVGDLASYGERIAATCGRLPRGQKDITLFAMQPLQGRGFQQELLGYSLMSALGISSDELDNQ